MPFIKRYPNRKLYDTQAKQYITLEGIADLIRSGEEVHVIDHASGEDLTELTLTQIILEQEKKQSGLLPRSVLAGLIQASGDRLSALQRTLASPINLLHQIDDEIKRRIHALVNAGELTEGEGRTLLEKLMGQAPKTGEKASLRREELLISTEALEQYLQERGAPSREDLQRLIDQVDDLTAQLEEQEPPSE
jgi:polyhydroxyalkanoate synthesis repressor PhaR